MHVDFMYIDFKLAFKKSAAAISKKYKSDSLISDVCKHINTIG